LVLGCTNVCRNVKLSPTVTAKKRVVEFNCLSAEVANGELSGLVLLFISTWLEGGRELHALTDGTAEQRATLVYRINYTPAAAGSTRLDSGVSTIEQTELTNKTRGLVDLSKLLKIIFRFFSSFSKLIKVCHNFRT